MTSKAAQRRKIRALTCMTCMTRLHWPYSAGGSKRSHECNAHPICKVLKCDKKYWKCSHLPSLACSPKHRAINRNETNETCDSSKRNVFCSFGKIDSQSERRRLFRFFGSNEATVKKALIENHWLLSLHSKAGRKTSVNIIADTGKIFRYLFLLMMLEFDRSAYRISTVIAYLLSRDKHTPKQMKRGRQ
jgi:hypothetical protein